MERRAFLGGVTGVLIYGLSELTGQGGKADPKPRREPQKLRRPEYLKQALADMKRSGRAGLILILPDEAKARLAMAKTLNSLAVKTPYPPFAHVDGPDAWIAFARAWHDAANDIQQSAVVICLSRSDAKRLYGALPTEDRILLDAKARIIARGASSPELTAQSLFAFVCGERSTHLRRIVRTTRQQLGDEERKQLDEEIEVLTSMRHDSKETKAAILRLKDIGPRVGPCLVLASLAIDDPERRELFRRTTALVTRSATRHRPLPYGTKTGLIPRRDPCPACGMGFPGPVGLKFIEEIK